MISYSEYFAENYPILFEKHIEYFILDNVIDKDSFRYELNDKFMYDTTPSGILNWISETTRMNHDIRLYIDIIGHKHAVDFYLLSQNLLNIHDKVINGLYN